MDLTKFMGSASSAVSNTYSKFDFALPSIPTAIAITSSMSSFGPTAGSSTLKKVMYGCFIIAILVAVVYAISMFIHIPGVSVGPTLPRTGPPSWTGPETYSEDANMNLTADVAKSVHSVDSVNYTVSFEMKIQEPFANTNAVRHIFHRGDAITINTAAPGAAPVMEDVAQTNKQLPLNLEVPTGTITMNPAVFLAPNSTNTLWIVIQNAGALATNVFVPDVPVYSPFRLTISLSNNVMDVYVDCKLVKTVRLTEAVPSATLTKIYGHLGKDFPGVVGAVRYYPISLTAKQIGQLCGLAPVLKL
jgi:hypothetical protein